MENPAINAKKFKIDEIIQTFIKTAFYGDKHSEPTQVK
jgi:hypothetical protein